ncbi:MAG: oxidoreductase [Parcubacteria group bacterium Gr01-1014_18]|nr:MAG: oxidoreductase [Parcubacteria group bacterium Greene0416_36]TSC81352.1 MAG: oxidoreductase [Parcubacteria group bacterium Gr01-1014_18]TSC99462.1 MAG: oxidoreductase [Parcubacteria group bacterium Greene1014_20]TSD07619.1 MAG: oxidoreductase [Parcubacteria group bacterium Greene0714_2]
MEEQKNPPDRKFISQILFFALLFLVLVAVGAGIALYSFFQSEKSLGPGELSGGAITVTEYGDPVIGPANALISVYEFSDFSCSFCRQSADSLRSILLRYDGKVKWVYKDFPIASLHPNAMIAAMAGACAHEQGKFVAMHDAIFANQQYQSRENLIRYAKTVGLGQSQFIECLDSSKFQSEVESDLREGISLGVTATPTWFINGQKIEGALSEEELAKIFDQILGEIKNEELRMNSQFTVVHS